MGNRGLRAANGEATPEEPARKGLAAEEPTVMRYYLMVMFAFPLLEVWDRWVAKHTEQLPYYGAIDITQRFGWHVIECGLYRVRAFHFTLPLVRDWRTRINDERWGWHRVMLLHIRVDPPRDGITAGWQRAYIAIPDSPVDYDARAHQARYP